MRPNTALMNFRLPKTLKYDFEQICQVNNILMTTQLNLLISDHIKNNSSAMY